MAEPTIELDLYQATDPENSPGIAIDQRQADGTATSETPQAEVTLTRSDAQIVYQEAQGEQANVSVARSEPIVRIEQGEPQIEVTATAEPQVSWSQIGEATVTFQTTGDDAAGTAAEADPAAAQTDADAAAVADQEAALVAEQDATVPAEEPQDTVTAADANTATDMQAPPAVRRDGYTAVDIAELTVDDLDGATVYGVQGENIGEIGNLVLAEGEAQDVIVDVGGFLGIGERQVRVPFADMSILRGDDNNDIRVYINATEDQLMSYPEVE